MENIYIILVNYNGWKDTLECIDSFSFLPLNYKIVVVDNKSSDDSIQHFHEIDVSNMILLEAETNDGFSAGNNIGIRYALEHGADYVVLLNNDTIIKSDFITPMIETSVDYENAVVTSKIMYAYEPNKIWYAGGAFNRITGRATHTGINEVDRGQYDHRCEVEFASGCCMLIPRAILEDVGLLSEDYFLYCEDLDYCCRIRNKKYKIIYEPRSVIFHKVNASTSKVSDTVTFYSIRNKLYIIDRYINSKFKLCARIYDLLETTKRLLTWEYNYNTVKEARKSYKQGKLGKRS